MASSTIDPAVQAALQQVSDDAAAAGVALTALATAQAALTQAQADATAAQAAVTQAQQTEATDLAALEALLTKTYGSG